MNLFGRWGEVAPAMLLSGLLLGVAGCERKAAADEGTAVPDQEEGTPAEPAQSKEEVATAEVRPGGKSGPEAERKDEPSPGEAATDAKTGSVAESESESEGKSAPEVEGEVEVEDKAPAEPWTLAQAGFAAHLPQDVDLYLDARKLKWVWELVDQLKGSAGLKKFLEEWLGDFFVESEDGAIADELKAILPLLTKEEVFVAVRGVAMAAEAGLEISQAVNRSMGRDLAKGFASGEMGEFMRENFGSDMPKELSRWLKLNVKRMGAQKNIAFYVGGRLAAEERKDVRKRFAALLGKAVEESEELKAAAWESGEVSWTGFEFSGSHVPAITRETPPEGMDEESWAEVQEELKKLTVVVACAEVKDFVVVAAGLGRDSIALAEAPEKSLAATQAFQFLGEFEADAMMATTFVGKRLVKSLVDWNRGLPLFEGMEEGLEAGPALRRKGEMLKGLRKFIEHQKARGAGTAFDHVGAVLAEGPVRYETRGGWLGSGLDLESPLAFAGRFGNLEKAPFVQGHWVLQKSYLERGRKQVDAAMRTVRLISEEVMEHLSKENEDDEEMLEKMARWKRDLAKGIDDVWHGYRDHFGKAFGREWAFVMDLQGEMIPAVGVGEEVVKKGRIPRAAFVRPLVKREALGESWELWQRALTNMFGIVAEAFDQPIPFPDTMTAEKDDLRTYFFPFPFATDDFLPSVSVSDDLFILGSSKTLSETVYAASLEAKAQGGEKRAGLWIDVNAEELWRFCEIWLEIYEEKRAARNELEEDDLKREKKEGGDGPIDPRAREGDDAEELPGGAEAEDAPDKKLDPADEEKLRAEIEDLLEEEVDPDEIELRGPLGLLSGGPSPEVLRTLLDKARWIRALRYRRWAEDGVPRASLRVKWAAP